MIEKNTIVTIHYTMRNGRGEMLETRQATYRHGSSDISPALQTQLAGLEPGQTKRIFINKGEENADDDFTFDVTIVSVNQPSQIQSSHIRPPVQIQPSYPLPHFQIHLLSGFLGSGKTTAIQQACRLLNESGIPTAVISNDQGEKLVDGAFFEHLGLPSRQVTNGCFCCNYKDLDRCIQSLTAPDPIASPAAIQPAPNPANHPAILFAESVGSCTDLVATVLKPLLNKYPGAHPTVSVFADANLLPDLLEDHTAFDPAVRYIYLKQLEEAQVIVVTKIDQTNNLTSLRQLLRKHYATKTILYQNSFNPEHILSWLQTLEQLFPQSNTLPSLNIDYERYGAGEAKLAWLDQQLVIESPALNACDAALALLNRLCQTNHPIGHLKCWIDGTTKISFTSTGTTDRTPIHATHLPIRPAANATLLINARIQTTPALLTELMTDAIQSTAKTHNCTIRTISASCFQPGFPRPTHRIP
jgi:CobW/HypB/UreG, nucleotide-binding domain